MSFRDVPENQELPMVAGPMGPFIHAGQSSRRRGSRPLTDYRSPSTYTLWWVGSGRCDLDTAQDRLRPPLPTMLLMQPGDDVSLHLTSGSEWGRLAFDALYQPLRRSGRHRNARVHVDEHCPQPRSEAIWGCNLPLIVPAGLLTSGKAMIDDCLAWWWRSDVHLLRANHRLGLWLSELVLAFTLQVKEGGDWFARCHALMEDRLEFGLKVEDMARAAGMSPSTFRRRFRERSGKSPREFLHGVRILHAKELLLRGDHDVEEVGNCCGYSSRTTFSAQFRRATGLSPMEWFRQHRPG